MPATEYLCSQLLEEIASPPGYTETLIVWIPGESIANLAETNKINLPSSLVMETSQFAIAPIVNGSRLRYTPSYTLLSPGTFVYLGIDGSLEEIASSSENNGLTEYTCNTVNMSVGDRVTISDSPWTEYNVISSSPTSVTVDRQFSSLDVTPRYIFQGDILHWRSYTTIPEHYDIELLNGGSD